MGGNQESSIYEQAKTEALRIFWEPEGSGMSYHDAVEAAVDGVVTSEAIARKFFVEILDERPYPEVFFRRVPDCATWTEIIRYIGAEVLREDVLENAKEMTDESDRRIQAGEISASSKLRDSTG